MKNKPIIIISGIVIATILVLYIRVFASNVATLEGNTLTQKIEDNKTIYHSNITPTNSDIKVIVNTYSDNNVSLEFDLTNNKFSYTVKFKEEINNKYYVEMIEGKNTIFDGYYTINYFGDIEYKEFYNLEGIKVSEDEMIQVIVEDNFMENGPIKKSYKPDMATIIKFATGGNVSLRGEWVYLIMLIVILILLIIDIRYPRFFFLLEHGLDVNNPEASDYYLMCQKMFRVGIAPLCIIYVIYKSLGF